MYPKFLYVLVVGFVLMLDPAPSLGQGLKGCEPPNSIDIEIGDALLTQAEIVALMNKRFYDSLAEFEDCLDCYGAKQNSSSSASGGQNGSAGDSVAVTGIQGTETASISTDNEVIPSDTESTVSATVQGTEPEDNGTNQPLLPNGKIPEDIPPADNDGALLAQIRLAAENEQDPALRAKLWNQYRQYKGLPLKEIPESNTQ